MLPTRSSTKKKKKIIIKKNNNPKQKNKTNNNNNKKKQQKKTGELAHDKTKKMLCAPSEDSDQPGHPPSLI